MFFLLVLSRAPIQHRTIGDQEGLRQLTHVNEELFSRIKLGETEEIHFKSHDGHDIYQRWWESEFGLPWESRELWDSSSAFNHVQHVSTPTLFVGGEKGWNVPVQNSEQLYQALRRRGVTTRLVVYPGEHHGGRTMPHQKDFLERRLAWYDQYVKGKTSPAPEQISR